MQKSAVAWLNKHVFQTPAWLIDPKILTLITNDLGVNSLAQVQESAINNLHNTSRLQRLIEAKSAYPNAYGIEDLYTELKNGIWSELKNNQTVTVHRRNLQRIYVEKLLSMLKPAAGPAPAASPFAAAAPSVDPMKTDIIAVTRATLKELHGELKAKAKSASDKMTRYHYEDCVMRLEKGLGLDD